MVVVVPCMVVVVVEAHMAVVVEADMVVVAMVEVELQAQFVSFGQAIQDNSQVLM